MNRIRQLRRQKNMTQQEVGQALGVGNTAVSMYENGRRSLDDKTIRNLCALFGCSADYLLGLSDYRADVRIRKPVRFREVPLIAGAVRPC